MGQYSPVENPASPSTQRHLLGMTFFDLPPDWRHRPLTDHPLATNVVDLYCTAGDRSQGAITLIICDEKNHFKGAIAIDLKDLTPDPPSPDSPATSRRRSPATPPGAALPSRPMPPGAPLPSRPMPAGAPLPSLTGLPATLVPGLTTLPGTLLPGSGRHPGTPHSGPAGTPTPRASSRSTRRAAALRPVIRPLQVYPGGALLLALGRRGPSTTTTSDREWAEGATRACRSLGVRLLGFYLASRDTVFPADLTTAAADLPTAA
jgi:hypothetical protein